MCSFDILHIVGTCDDAHLRFTLSATIDWLIVLYICWYVCVCVCVCIHFNNNPALPKRRVLCDFMQRVCTSRNRGSHDSFLFMWSAHN